MISKGKIAGLLALCSLATLTCGFSAWIVGGTSGSEADGIKVKVGNVIDSRNILQFDTAKGKDGSGISCLEYCPDGFVNDGIVDVGDGYLNVYLKLNIQNIKKAYGTPKDTSVYSSFYISTNLSFSSPKKFSLVSNSYINPFTSDKDCGISVSYHVDNSSQTNYLSGTNSLESGLLSSTYNGFEPKFLSQSSASSYFYVNFSYRFSIDYTKVIFRSDIYPNLENSTFTLSVACGGY